MPRALERAGVAAEHRLCLVRMVDVWAVIDAGEPFTDPDFPPGEDSLAHDWSAVPSQELWRDFEWRRAKDFMPPKTGPFNLNIHPDGIRQGALGDCYLLGSCSILAEVSARVRELFLVRHYNESGIYAVRLLWRGEWKTVVVDDYFPYWPASESSVFWTCHAIAPPEAYGGCLQAFAKLHGSYQAIIAGSPGEALHMMTGAPSLRYVATDPAVFEQLLKAEQFGWPMMAATGDVAGEDAMVTVGLVEGHAYSILDAKQVTAADGSRHKLIKLRNPWACVEWRGDWSDRSHLWTDDLRAKLKHPESHSTDEDGIFWISMKDIVPYLSSFYVNHYLPGWRFHAVKTTPPPELPPRPLGVLITLSDANASGPPKDLWLSLRCYCSGTSKPALFFQVLRLSDGIGAYELETQTDYVLFHKVNRDLKAAPGQYLAILRVIVPEDSPEASVVFDSYSEGRVQMKALSYPQLWAELWPSLEVLAAENGDTSSYAEFGAPRISRTLWQSATLGLVCMLYSNRSEKAELNEEISFRLDNLELLECDGQSGRPAESSSRQVQIRPGEQELLVIRQVDVNARFSVSFSRSFSLRS